MQRLEFTNVAAAESSSRRMACVLLQELGAGEAGIGHQMEARSKVLGLGLVLATVYFVSRRYAGKVSVQRDTQGFC